MTKPWTEFPAPSLGLAQQLAFESEPADGKPFSLRVSLSFYIADIFKKKKMMLKKNLPKFQDYLVKKERDANI